MIGSFELISKSISESTRKFKTNYNYTISKSREPVIYPHEFARLDDDMVLAVNNNFCRVNKEPYYKNKPIKTTEIIPLEIEEAERKKITPQRITLIGRPKR